MAKFHEPVLREKVFQYLIVMEEGLIVDGTLGDGGHTEFILQNTGPGLRVLGIDRDANALLRAKERLAPFGDRVTFVHGNYSEIQSLLKKLNVEKIDGLLLDLGISSPQIEIAERGFSFMRNGPLDMRMDLSQEITAATLLQSLTDRELESIIRDYGEERHYRKIVRAVRKAQAINPIQTTLQLSKILSGALYSKRPAKIHPATRTFQALRIAVNRELMHLKTALQDSLGVLNAGARLVTIAFHSLEDRIVKTFFRDEEKGCICPPRIPVCACGKKSTLKIITKRVLAPDEEETTRNPRSSSAKMRVAERVYV
ncbi:MAG: 16S rRNA (cytosine(1402)-N(4))-methyltransferase RsmH [Nitrospinae bacterium]|nr:16S rRNA (cytosine(1402)-N(4))-methyltransferase RsmH [Nitrospinota bacterium]